MSQSGTPAEDSIPAVEVQLIRRRVRQPEPVVTTNIGETARPVRRTVVVEQMETTTDEQPASSGADGASSGVSSDAQDSTQSPGGVGQRISNS